MQGLSSEAFYWDLALTSEGAKKTTRFFTIDCHQITVQSEEPDINSGLSFYEWLIQ